MPPPPRRSTGSNARCAARRKVWTRELCQQPVVHRGEPQCARVRAEEQAAKTTIKMIIPLVLFVLPSIIFVTLGPAIFQLFRILAPGAH